MAAGIAVFADLVRRARPLAAAFVVALGLLAPGTGALAQAPAPSGPGAAPTAPAAPGAVTAPMTSEIEALAQTLRDEAARAELLRRLDALIAADRAVKARTEPPAHPALSDRAAAYVAERVAALAARLGQVLSVLRDAPRLAPWLESQVTLAAKRDRLIGLLWRFVVIVGLGMAAQFLFRKSTNGARKRLERVPEGESLALRAARFVARAAMLYLNALAYGAGAYGAYAVLPMAGAAGAVLLVGASAFFVAKLILATVRVVVSPGVAGLRCGRFGDETAQYLYIWARRLVRIFVYAFFFIEALRLVGLPAAAHESLLYLTGLIFAGFLVVIVLQNRAAVADAIRGRGAAGFAAGTRAWLANVWHIAAFAYIAAVYLVWLFKLPGGFEFLLRATVWTVAVVAAGRLIALGFDRGLDGLLRIGDGLGERLPGIEARANRYMTVLRTFAHWVIGTAAALLVLYAWGLDTLAWLASPDGTALIARAVTVLVIVALAFAAWEAVNLMLARYVARLDGRGANSARVKTLLPLVRTTATVLIAGLAGLIALSEIGVNIAPLLAGAGVLGLAIGFGSQKLVQDVITGLFILAEDTLAVGDTVKLSSDHSGVVEALSIRSVRLRDVAGTVHSLPFSEVKTVINMTKGWAYYVLDVGVAYRENVDHVIAVLREIGAELQKDTELGPLIAEPLEILGLDKFADSAVVIRARIKVVPPNKQWVVGREFNRRMKSRFDAEGIEIPFPHQTVYFGEDRAHRAPPVHVEMAPETPPKG